MVRPQHFVKIGRVVEEEEEADDELTGRMEDEQSKQRGEGTWIGREGRG